MIGTDDRLCLFAVSLPRAGSDKGPRIFSVREAPCVSMNPRVTGNFVEFAEVVLTQ